MHMYKSLFTTLALFGSVVFCDAQDSVFRIDRKTDKNSSISGKIEGASPAGIKISVAGKVEVVHPSDIVRVNYSTMPSALQFKLQKVYDAYNDRDLETANTEMAEVLKSPDYAKCPPDVKAYLQYWDVTLKAQVAESENEIQEATRNLADFVTSNDQSWMFALASEKVALLYADQSRYVDAKKYLEQVVKSPDVPADLKLTAKVGLINVNFQEGELDEADTRVKEMIADRTTPASMKDRLDMYQLGIVATKAAKNKDEKATTAAIARINAAIAKTQDKGLRGLGYNVIGDSYKAMGRNRDAMWSYLWVDVVYNQDSSEHSKALSRLISIFEQDNDTAKVQLFREKLQRVR
ncbi:MAG: hypothetical protein R3B84_24695 [Zavarzinella sp.]